MVEPKPALVTERAPFMSISLAPSEKPVTFGPNGSYSRPAKDGDPRAFPMNDAPRFWRYSVIPLSPLVTGTVARCISAASEITRTVHEFAATETPGGMTIH